MAIPHSLGKVTASSGHGHAEYTGFAAKMFDTSAVTVSILK